MTSFRSLTNAITGIASYGVVTQRAKQQSLWSMSQSLLLSSSSRSFATFSSRTIALLFGSSLASCSLMKLSNEDSLAYSDSDDYEYPENCPSCSYDTRGVADSSISLILSSVAKALHAIFRTVTSSIILRDSVFTCATTFLESASPHRTTPSTRLKDGDKDDPYNLRRWMNRWSAGNIRFHKDTVHPMLLKYTDLLLKPAIDQTTIILIPLCGKTVDMAYLASFQKGHDCNDKTNGMFHVVGVDCSNLAIEQFVSENEQLHLVPKTTTVVGAAKDKNNNNIDSPTCSSTWWFGRSISLLVGNFFQLKKDDIVTAVTDTNSGGGGVHLNKNTSIKVDAVWDRGSLVAIDPSLRNEYVNVIGRLMSSNRSTSDSGSGNDHTTCGRYLLTTVVRGNLNDARGPPFTVTEETVRELFEKQPWVESIELLEVRSGTADETSWYDTISMWYRLGFNTKEMIFLIKTR